VNEGKLDGAHDNDVRIEIVGTHNIEEAAFILCAMLRHRRRSLPTAADADNQEALIHVVPRSVAGHPLHTQ